MRDDSVLPELGASDVLVRTHAVGVNPLDMRVSFLNPPLFLHLSVADFRFRVWKYLDS